MKSYNTRRRGTSIAAAALSFALVAPLAQPVAFAAESDVVEQKNNPALPYNVDPNCQTPSPENAYTYGSNADLRNAVEADAIANKYIRNGLGTTNAKNTLSGHVFIGGYGTITNGTTVSKVAVPEGTKVYMQWRSATGVLSPIYVTETHTIDPDLSGAGGAGSYAFDLRDGFYDNQGNHHVFGAYNDQYYRVWVEPTVNATSGNMMYPVRAGDGIRPYFRTSFGGTRNTGQWQLIGTNQQKVDRWMAELPIDVENNNKNYMKATDVVEMPYVGYGEGSNTGKNRVGGRVWLEGGQGADASNGMTGPSFQDGRYGRDVAAEGYKVFLTTLTEEGVKGLAAVSNEKAEDRTRVTRELLQQHPEWLEKTYVATTDEEGKYSIDGIETEGRRFIDTTRNVFMWVEDSNGVLMQAASAFVNPEFGNAVSANNWSPTVVPSRLVGAVINENFAIQSTPYESNIQLFIKNFDEFAYPGQPGDTAELLIDGTVPLQETRIVWTRTDKNGNTVVVDTTGEPVMDGRNPLTNPADADGTSVLNCGDEANANMKIPAGAEDGDLYTAYLFVGADVRASDSFIVSAGQAAKYQPLYPNVVPADSSKSGEPVFFEEKNGITGAEVARQDVPVARYELAPSAPEGAQVDANGVVTLPASVRGGEKNIQVPVMVVYKDDTRDLALAEFEPIPNDSDKYEPVYAPTTTDSKKQFEVPAPSWTDANGDPLSAAPAATFAIDNKALPKYKDGRRDRDVFTNVQVGQDGKITVESAEKWGEYQIPVKVTYDDGSVETVLANVHVNSQADKFEPQAENQVLDKNAEVPDAADVITNTDKLPTDTKYEWVVPPSTEAPGTFDNAVRVTYPDGSTEDVPVSIRVKGQADEFTPEGKDLTVEKNDAAPEAKTAIANVGDLPENTTFEWLDKPDTATLGNQPATVVVTYPDNTQERVDITITVQDTTAPTVTVDGNDQTVTEHKPIETITVKSNEERSTFSAPNLPDGLKLDEQTGEITGTPEIGDWREDEEERELTFTVVVEDPSGNETKQQVTITVQRDTDEDGTPDLTDTDDDNDGVSDEDEKKAGTDPKNAGERPWTALQPIQGAEIGNNGQTVVEHKPIEDITITPSNPGAKVEVKIPENVEGLTVDPETNTITGSPEITNWGDDEEERDVEITVVVSNPDGSKTTETVTVKVQRDTDEDGTPDLTDTDDDNDGVSDEDEKKAGSDPKNKNSIPAAKLTPTTPVAPTTSETPSTSTPVIVPIVVSVEGEPETVKPTDEEQSTGLTVKNPSGDTKVSAKDEDGKDIKVTIDEQTGEIKVTPGENVDGPITVTVTDPNLPNGKYEVEVPVQGHEKDRNDNPTTVNQDNVTPVDPTDDEQGTGIVVNNNDDDTEVTAKDEDGNDVTVTIDPETGEVKLTPGTDVDGPITVTITDPDLPNGEITVEVPVNGHEKNRDDNNSDTPTKGTTEVDQENVTPVDPTDDEQGTGIVVNNPDGDTKVSGSDEDGNDIPVTIDDKTGEINVTPGTDVDGPITVTITDPDLPNGSVEVKVPVNGHEEGRNDNGTTVNTDKVTPVDPTDEEQPTGIVVNNKDADTTVSAKDEDGNDVKVTVDPETGEIKVTPGENVDGPITVTITDPDLPNGEITVEVPVNGHDKNRDDNGSHTSTATTPDVPADGKEHVVGRIDKPKENGGYTGTLLDKDGNEIEGSTVVIDPETGEIKVTVPSGTTPGEATVVIKDKDGKTVKDKDGHDLKVNIVSPSYGDGSTNVKPGEKGTTKDPFEGQKVNKPFDKVEVTTPDNAGDWTFTIDGDGKITGTAPSEKQLQDSFTKTFPNGTTSWEDFKKQFEDIGTPTVTGSITLKGGTDPVTGEATFELVGQDGKSIFDPNGDFDGDGVSNEDEITDGTNPFDKTDFKTTVDESGKQPVKVGKGNQDTGVTVTFPEGQKPGVTAVDEDGNTVFVEIGDDGKLKVNPDTDANGNPIDVDGPITVTIDGVKDPIIIDVIGADGRTHENGVDDNNKSDTGKTTVDQSAKQPVTEGQGNQETGVTVKFPAGKKPTVVATDEDGNPVAVEITDDGKLKVNPDDVKDANGNPVAVDGPIKVVITDSEGNRVEVTVDVIGKDGKKHQAGVDDNGAPAGTASQIDTGKCVASALGFGLPLLALIPIGLMAANGVPGLDPMIAEFEARVEAANTALQQQIGIFNPQMAAQAAEVNAQLKEIGLNLATGTALLVLLPIMIASAFGIADNCAPGDGSSAGSSNRN